MTETRAQEATPAAVPPTRAEHKALRRKWFTKIADLKSRAYTIMPNVSDYDRFLLRNQSISAEHHQAWSFRYCQTRPDSIAHMNRVIAKFEKMVTDLEAKHLPA